MCVKMNFLYLPIYFIPNKLGKLDWTDWIDHPVPPAIFLLMCAQSTVSPWASWQGQDSRIQFLSTQGSIWLFKWTSTLPPVQLLERQRPNSQRCRPHDLRHHRRLSLRQHRPFSAEESANNNEESTSTLLLILFHHEKSRRSIQAKILQRSHFLNQRRKCQRLNQ